jgi:hypothetical protein
MNVMNKPRVKDTTRTNQSGRIVLIRDGRILAPHKRRTPRLAASGPLVRA